MTQILTANIGSYPRIGEEKDQQRHRRGLAHLQTKELSKHAFRDVEHSVIQEAVREQIEAGVSEVTDGHITWHDPISHFTRHLSNIKITGLGRYFDNNFYYRTPIITAKPKRLKSATVDDFIYTQKISNKPVRTVITGPYTLAQHCKSAYKPYQKFSTRLEFFTDIMRAEIEELSTNGAKLIQIDEPSLGQHPEDIKMATKSLTKLVEGLPHSRISLSVYFNPVGQIFDALTHLPIDVLNLDLTINTKKTLEKILQSKTKKALGFGLINARTTRMEPIDPILNAVKKYINQTNPPFIYLIPSTGLELIPRMYAFAKLKLLTKIKEEIEQNVSEN